MIPFVKNTNESVFSPLRLALISSISSCRFSFLTVFALLQILKIHSELRINDIIEKILRTGEQIRRHSTLNNERAFYRLKIQSRDGSVCTLEPSKSKKRKEIFCDQFERQ